MELKLNFSSIFLNEEKNIAELQRFDMNKGENVQILTCSSSIIWDRHQLNMSLKIDNKMTKD